MPRPLQSTPLPQKQKRRGRSDVDGTTRTPSVLPGFSDKENGSPPTTGRSSKQKALQQLHKAKDDIALFQKEMKRKGGVTHGRKRSIIEVEGEADHSEDHSPDGEATRVTQRQSKKAKASVPIPAEQPPVEHKMMVSGDERWRNNAKKEAEDKVC